MYGTSLYSIEQAALVLKMVTPSLAPRRHPWTSLSSYTLILLVVVGSISCLIYSTAWIVMHHQYQATRPSYGPMNKMTSFYKNNEQHPGLAKSKDPISNHDTEELTSANMDDKRFPCIDKESPSATEIQQLLMNERRHLKITKPKNANNADYDYFKDMGLLYELVYAFVAEFQSNNIPIFLVFGSHIGARRHHGIIPLGDKDVDFAIFGLDNTQNKAIIRKVLHDRGLDTIKDTNFGYHVSTKLSHYFDFWLFEQHKKGEKEEVQCVGNQDDKGCADWYQRFHKPERQPPIFPSNNWFPPRYQMFGTHKVPIPNTSGDIDIHYSGGHWNTYCGDQKKNHPNSERLCSNFYGDYPFVFIKNDMTEELRQGSIILHQSPIAAPIHNTYVYSKKNNRKAPVSV
mmetsp:Transcript_11286/g.20692  ORF Transcript_11286/g.20692 Transcript_11286/m.20692 type:complete len:400 (+) Transcript_11286:41-1240(+)